MSFGWGHHSCVEGNPGLHVHGNLVVNFDGSAIGCSGCHDAIIENNVIVGTPSNAWSAGIHVPDAREQSGWPLYQKVNERVL